MVTGTDVVKFTYSQRPRRSDTLRVSATTEPTKLKDSILIRLREESELSVELVGMKALHIFWRAMALVARVNPNVGTTVQTFNRDNEKGETIHSLFQFKVGILEG